MQLYDTLFGLYPFANEKYGHAECNFGGGMEHQTMTFLGGFGYELIAHELGHHWFGDKVTCGSWQDIWLNEGFATYYQSLYEEHKHGRDAMLYELYLRARNITGITNDTNAIVRRTYDSPREMFGYLAYPKGGWVLHMLRSQLGEDLYRRCIKTYLERHQFDNVVTEDLRAVIEELSGRSFDQFFDQWVYHAHHPELDITNRWDETAKLAKVTVRQAQALSENVLLFHFPLAIRFKGNFGTIDRQVQVAQKEEDFYFPLPEAPQIVRVDPAYTLLAKIKVQTPTPMLYAQLADQDDAVGRLLAIEQLSAKKDKETVAKLKERLNNDPFYGVRLEASQALRSIHNDEALDALLASTKQSDARVRQQVVTDTGGFYRDTACDSARKTLEAEKNPDILSAAIRALGGYAKPEVSAALLKYLNSQSYRNELADAAIAAMRLQDDPAYLGPLLETLAKRESEFTSRGFGQGLSTVAYLARNEEKKDRVREFLAGYVNHKKRAIRLAAMGALGTLGDPKAIAALEKLATAAKESPERTAAEKALADLRAARKPVDDFKNLRSEVLDLQKQNRELRKELDELKKKVAVTESKAGEASSKKQTARKQR
jgi:aminopeptidase N